MTCYFIPYILYKYKVMQTLGQGWQTFSGQGKIVNILGLAGQMASVVFAQLCCYNVKIAVGGV